MIDEDGITLAVGTKADVLQAAGTDAEVIDLGGRMVLPGLQNIHLLAVEAGVNYVLCGFDAFDDLNRLRDTVQDCAENGVSCELVLEANVNMVNLLEIHDNPVEFLDAVVPDRPVLILDYIGHGAWANT